MQPRAEYEVALAHRLLVYSPDRMYRCVWVVNPYIGCPHRCVYCYAASSKYYHLGKPEDYWRRIIVRINAPSLLDRELSENNNRREIICLSTMCDPYNPGEREFRVTRGILKVLLKRGIPCHIITKSPRVVDDWELLRGIGKKSWCAVTFSVAFNEEYARLLEPGAPPPGERFGAMSFLSEKGIMTGITLAPIIPGINDSPEDIEEQLIRAKNSGAKYVIYEVLSLHQGQSERLYNFLFAKMRTVVEKIKQLYRGARYPSPEYVEKIKNMIQIFAKRLSLRISPPEFVPYRIASLDQFSRANRTDLY